MTIAELRHLAAAARELVAESDDPRAQLVASAFLQHLVVNVDDTPAGSRPGQATPPPCAFCGRRFAVALATGRHPVHGPVATRCVGSGTRPDSEN
jgi:hypothetical protein